ncbi:MAG: hypothetical protein LC130_16725 [Bryobacterales bacterium]|nr:hypothetical protein [Bryobacterales bacterium]
MKNHRKFICSIMSVFILVVLGLQAVAGEAQTQGARTIMPDQTVQSGISKFIVSIQGSSLESEEDFAAAVDSFFSTNGSSSKVNLEQMLLAYGGKEEHLANPQEEMLKRVMLARLVQGMDQEEVLEVAAPLLESTTNSRLLSNVHQVLGFSISKKGRSQPDQPGVRKYLAKHKDTPPYGLIKYLYRTGDEEAVDVVGSVYGDKSSPAYSGTGKHGLAAVEAVAAGGHWWEELYVAEKMKQNPKLRDPELVERLKKSKNTVVSASILEVEDEKK